MIIVLAHTLRARAFLRGPFCARVSCACLCSARLCSACELLAREFYARMRFRERLVRVDCARVSLRVDLCALICALAARAFLRVDLCARPFARAFCACLFARAFMRAFFVGRARRARVLFCARLIARVRCWPPAPRAPRNFSLYPNSFILHMHTMSRGKLN